MENKLCGQFLENIMKGSNFEKLTKNKIKEFDDIKL